MRCALELIAERKLIDAEIDKREYWKREKEYDLLIEKMKKDSIKYCEEVISPLIEENILKFKKYENILGEDFRREEKQYNDKKVIYYYNYGKEYQLDFNIIKEYLKKYCYNAYLVDRCTKVSYPNRYTFIFEVNPKCLK